MMNQKIIKSIFYGCMIAGLISCATPQHDLSKELKNRDYLKNSESVNYSGELYNDQNAEEQVEKKTEIYPGSGEFINVKAANKHVREVSLKGEITFNFEGESLPAVVNFILGEVLKENYVIAPGIGGNVTFATAKPINKSQVLPILELLLSWNNAALVHVDGRYHVLPKDQAIKGNLTPRVGSIERRKGYQVVAVPLTYVSPAEMEKIITPYVKDGAIVKADNARNIMFLAGTKFELRNYLDTIEIFDVDWLAGMSTGIFYLQRVDAADIVGELEILFGEGAETPLAGMFRFVPLERLNGVLVITPQKDYLDKAQEWIRRLDRADLEGGANLYVYSVKNIKADDLAGYLNDAFGGSRGSSASRKASNGSVVSGQKGKEVSSSGAKNKTATRARTTSNSNSDIQITAIEESNQLLIKADVAEYEKIMSAVKRLDIVPLQVHIELKIIEVTLNNSMESGMELFFGDAVGSSSSSTSSSTNKGYNLSTASATSGSGGLSYRLLGTDAEAKISLLETQDRVALISSPSLFVMNNKQATINVGDSIPVVSTSYISTGSTTTSSTSYIQTGVQVDITPRVNPGGLVYMEITQDVSTAGAANTTGNRTISKREITSEIAVQSGQTIVMGGLISQNDTIAKNGVPFFSRIPVIGSAFGKHKKTRDKTELMVLITPTVVENAEQARALTLEYAKKFEGLKPIKGKSIETKEKKDEN